MILNLLCMLFLPLLLVGLINRSKAIAVGRKGAPLLQAWWHFLKLLRKDEVKSHTASWITDWAPSVAFAATFIAAFFVPFGSRTGILGFGGDFVFILYLLALAKAAMVLAAMDCGSSFEGMGASREISFTAFLEPAFMLIVGTLLLGGRIDSLAALVTGHTINTHDIWSVITALLTTCALLIMLLVEAARVPFDDPATHLELTMIHEVMILDYSGFSLALIHYTAALKMLIYASLISHLLIPMGIAMFAMWYLILIFVQAIGIGLLESWIPRFRMNRNLELVSVPVSISLLVISVLIAKFIGAW